jgi:hypothetical protein
VATLRSSRLHKFNFKKRVLFGENTWLWNFQVGKDTLGKISIEFGMCGLAIFEVINAERSPP